MEKKGSRAIFAVQILFCWAPERQFAMPRLTRPLAVPSGND